MIIRHAAVRSTYYERRPRCGGANRLVSCLPVPSPLQNSRPASHLSRFSNGRVVRQTASKRPIRSPPIRHRTRPCNEKKSRGILEERRFDTRSHCATNEIQRPLTCQLQGVSSALPQKRPGNSKIAVILLRKDPPALEALAHTV